MSEPTHRPTLLPANSSALERGLDLGFGALLDRIVPPFPELMNPSETPVAFLPYLAADRGVSEWDADASESEKRLTVSLSWQIERQAGTRRALSHAVESLGFTPNISAWYQQRPLGVPYSFDVQALIGTRWSSGDHNRLIRRVNAAKSERDEATITIVHTTHAGLQFAVAVDPGLNMHDNNQATALPEIKMFALAEFNAGASFPLSECEWSLSSALPA